MKDSRHRKKIARDIRLSMERSRKTLFAMMDGFKVLNVSFVKDQARIRSGFTTVRCGMS